MNHLAKAQVVSGLRGFAAMLFTVAASPVLNASGISFLTISLGFGVLYIVLALAEIPTGAWADIFGSRKSAIFGGLLQTLSLVVLGFNKSEAWWVLLGFFLYGLGSSFVSGALSSLLFGIAKEEGRESFNDNQYFSILEKTNVASFVFASISIGFFSEWFGRGSFFIAGAFYFLSSLFITFRLAELPPAERIHASAKKEFFQRLKEGFSGVMSSIELKTLLPVRMLHQVETILGILWLPWIRDLGGGDDRWMSALATGSYVLRYLVNHYYASKIRPISYMPRIAYSLMLMAVGSVICIFAQNPWIALFGVWTMAGARGLFLPAVQAIQHNEFSERVRATGLSVMNFSVEVMIAISYFAVAPLLDKLSIPIAWTVSAACFVVASFLCIPALMKQRAKNEG